MKVTVHRFATLLPVPSVGTVSFSFSIFPGEDEALEDFLAKDWEEELIGTGPAWQKPENWTGTSCRKIGAMVR